MVQLAAKVLYSPNPADSFSAYVLPPQGTLTPEVSALTGITDEFLRSGGVDASTGVFHGPAPPFDKVYEAFCSWCEDRRGGKPAVLVAHNARFDVGMLEGEIKRLGEKRRRSGSFQVPCLADNAGIESVVDTLAVLRSSCLWKGSKPASFKQGDVYEKVVGGPMAGAHNAMGDVLGLEAILGGLKGWEEVAERMQWSIGRVGDTPEK